MRNEKQMEAYYERQRKSNPILMPSADKEDVNLMKLLQEKGVVKNKGLLLHKFKSGAPKEFLYSDSLGQKMKIRFNYDAAKGNETIEVFNQRDSCQYKFAEATYGYGEQQYNVPLETTYANKKLLILINYWYIVNGDNYDLTVFEITFNPIKGAKDE